jgi:hypothetical protein
LSKSKTSDSQTIDSDTGNYNTNIASCPTKIVTTITLTSRITLMKLITSKKVLFVHTITTARAGACVEWMCRIKRVWRDRRISEHHSRSRCRGQPWRRPAPGRRKCNLHGRHKRVQYLPAKCALKLHTLHRSLLNNLQWR